MSLLPPPINQPALAARPPPERRPPHLSLSPSINQPCCAAGAPADRASCASYSIQLNQAARHAQQELTPNEPPPSRRPAQSHRPRSGTSPRKSASSPPVSPPSVNLPCAAGAPPEPTSYSLPLSSRPAHSRSSSPLLIPPPINHPAVAAAPPPERAPNISLIQSATRSRSSPRKSLFPPSSNQPRAAGPLPRRASSLLFYSPMRQPHTQRELPQKQPTLPFLYRAAPRNGSSPPKEPPSSLYRADQRSRSLPQMSLLPLQINHPALAAPPPPTPPETAPRLPLSQSALRSRIIALPVKAFSLPLLSSPVQRELPPKEPPFSPKSISPPSHRDLRPQKEPYLSLIQSAPCSESSAPRQSLLSPSYSIAQYSGSHARSGSCPRKSLLPPPIKQPALTASPPPERAFFLPQSICNAEQKLSQK